MLRMSKINILFLIVISVMIPFLTLFLECNIIFLLTFFIWCYLVKYSYSDIENKALLFSFLMMFFLFLIGRDFLEQIFLYKVEAFDDESSNHAYFSMLLSLCTIGFFYKLFFSRLIKKNVPISIASENICNIRRISKVVYYITMIFAMIINAVTIKFVFTYGYAESYIGLREQIYSSGILFIVQKISVAMPVALCIFLATMPSKKEVKIPIIVYVLNLFFTIGQGNRSTLMLGLLFLFVYFISRQSYSKQETWFRKEWMYYISIMIPFLAIVFSWYNLWRFDESTSDFQWYTGIFDFFYSQGITGNIMKYSYELYDELNDQSFYILEFAKSGLIGRLLGIDVYQGNSVDHALYGGSFMHALSYKLLGNTYLSGRGTGSCYISELYQDFLYPGVVFGSILYAYLLANVSRLSSKKSIVITSIQLLMIQQLLWAPRGSFSGFLAVIFYPTTIITFFLIFGLNCIVQLGKKVR